MKRFTRLSTVGAVLATQILADHCGLHGIATVAMLALVPVASWALSAFATATTTTVGTVSPVVVIPDTIVTGQYAPTRVV